MTGTIEIDDPAKITKANELINKGYVDDKFLMALVYLIILQTLLEERRNNRAL